MIDKSELACVQMSPLPQKKKLGFFSEGGGMSVHRLIRICQLNKCLVDFRGRPFDF